MPMRTDCRHYKRRTSAAREVVEGCRLDAAPDAPYRCPENCPLFEEVKVSRAGWQVGSLGTPEPTANVQPVTRDDDGLFDTLESEFSPDLVAEIEDQERRRGKGKWWKKRKK